MELEYYTKIIGAVTASTAMIGGGYTLADKFGYKFTLDANSQVTPGVATLMAHIKYKCPEGEVIVNYPSHKNLMFTIKESNV